MRLAIIGAGVSGLVVAHLLHREHDITLFEADAHIGGHVNTIAVDTPDQTHHVDTGFVVYNEQTYPNFSRLLRLLGVSTQPSDMSMSVRSDRGDFEYSSRVPNGLFADRGHLLRPRFHRMIVDHLRFNRDARRYLRTASAADGVCLADYLGKRRYSEAFVERMLVPLAASVWSADRDRLLRFPARYVLAFLDSHGVLSPMGRPRWRTVCGGSSRYVEALVRPFADRLRLRTPVRRVTRVEDSVEVTPQGCQPLRFDQVVIATHSDQALRMLGDATARERALLEAFPYQENEVVLHTDASLMPRRRRAWASWNYHLPADRGTPTAVTYHMNRLQSLRADRDFCVTVNRTDDIDPARVVRRLTYAHPLYTQRSVAAQAQHDSINGANRTYFCGAYWGNGFHEDAVCSALRVCAHFGKRFA